MCLEHDPFSFFNFAVEAVCLAARSIVNDTPREESDNALIKGNPTAYGNIKKKEQKDRAQPETFTRFLPRFS